MRLTGIEKRYLAVLDPRFGPFGAEALYRTVAEQPRGPGTGRGRHSSRKSPGRSCSVRWRLCPAAPGRGGYAGHRQLYPRVSPRAGAPDPDPDAGAPVGPALEPGIHGLLGRPGGAAPGTPVGGARRPALVVACELSSLHFQYTDELDQLTANVLFADGAAAMMLGPRRAAARIAACRCAALPEQADQMVWFADDNGLRLRLSQDLPDTLAASVPATVTSFLGDHDTSVAAVDHWLVHPGGPQILDAVQQSLSLPADALQLSRSVLRRYGNMLSPTIFFILKELLASKVDGRCLAMAFGPGLTIEMVLLDIHHGDL